MGDKTIQKSAIEHVNHLLEHACSVYASDVHVDPRSSEFTIHLRVQGVFVLHEIHDLSEYSDLLGRIKVLAKLRSDIHDRSQDGRFEFRYMNGHVEEKIDLRVSILPTFYGENIVIRILRPEFQRTGTLKSLGLLQAQSEIVQSKLKDDQGIILVVGPTGSGKTTTIYTLIESLRKLQKNIITIEDPIEYVMQDIRQVQVSSMSGFGFADALRAILRQDPDVIVVGEIRDPETARLAFQASVTGHLVIATVHAEDSASVHGRLSDLGVSREMLHSLILIISQRLIKATETKLKRTGVFEVIPVEGMFKIDLFQNSFPEYIRKSLKKHGAYLLEDAMAEYVHAHQSIRSNTIESAIEAEQIEQNP